MKIRKSWGPNLINLNQKDLPGLKFRFLYNSVKNQKGKLLEIGCAEGKYLKSLYELKKDIKYFGCDIDQVAIKKSKKMLPLLSLQVADGLNLPYKNGQFDVVILMDYLEHVPDYRKAIKEVYRVLKKNGLVSAFVPCEGNPWSFYKLTRPIIKDKVLKTKEHTQMFQAKNLLRFFEDIGFKVKTINYSYHFIGCTFDFVFYLLLAFNKNLEKMWWTQNQFYFPKENITKNIRTQIFNFLLKITSIVAYFESVILKNIYFGSIGLHLVLEKTQK